MLSLIRPTPFFSSLVLTFLVSLLSTSRSFPIPVLISSLSSLFPYKHPNLNVATMTKYLMFINTRSHSDDKTDIQTIDNQTTDRQTCMTVHLCIQIWSDIHVVYTKLTHVHNLRGFAKRKWRIKKLDTAHTPTPTLYPNLISIGLSLDDFPNNIFSE